MQVLKGRAFRIILILSFFFLLTTYQSNFKSKITILSIKKINILGTKYLEEEVKNEIYNQIINKDLFFINRNDLKNLLNKSAWVDQYSLKKIYPDQINLIVKEFIPIALQRFNNNFYIINSDFRKIKINDEKHLEFLTFVGNPDIDEIKNLYNNLLKNNLITSVRFAEYMESQRWDLVLKNNSRILLPRSNLNEQSEKLSNILNNIKIFKTLDLRFNHRFIINKYD
ncbi:MAG: FtsQ-type POTRA domain-containing protein [Pelagibacteraceae bacterium]